MEYYDRYYKFRSGPKIKPVPFIKIDTEGGDIYIEFDRSKMRFDSLSYKYYGDPNYGWLILQANPQYSSYEYLIEDKSILRIPYPLQSAISRYERGIESYGNINEV